MYEKLLKQWADEQGFQLFAQDHRAVLSNLVLWLDGNVYHVSYNDLLEKIEFALHNAASAKCLCDSEVGFYCERCTLVDVLESTKLYLTTAVRRIDNARKSP